MIVRIKVECFPDEGESEGLDIKVEVPDPGKMLKETGILELMAGIFAVAKESVDRSLVLRLVEEVLE